MNFIQIVNGTKFKIIWAAVANVDGAFRFAAVNEDSAELFRVFSNPENCSRLIRIYDTDETVFEGYTVFRGITINYDGTMIVTLSKI